MDTSQRASFYGYPELESIRLLFELMTEPGKYNIAMESFIARVTSRLAWGTSTPSDELKQRARELLIGVSPTGALGNKLPFIMSLPEKLISAKAWEVRRSRTERKFFETMQQDVQDDIDGKARPKNQRFPLLRSLRPTQSWTRMFLEKKASWGFASELEGAFAVGMHGIAGALTIAAPMQSFCLALCHYPQYQPILHAEVDSVLGDRMPTFSDMPDMPVLRAFIRETLRWRPPVPTGIPHELIQDDLYEGYHIPAGSVMHPLEWSISRDPKVFPDPDAWNPLRWLDHKYPTYQEPLEKFPTITQYSQFGYGRRTCQGMGVTEADLFVGLGSVAWLFSMTKDEPEEEEETAAEATPEMAVPEASEEVLASGERSFFELNAERIKRQSWSPRSPVSMTFPTDMPTPPPEDSSPTSESDFMNRKATLKSLTLHANDSAISIPGEYPPQPEDLGVPSSSTPSPPKIRKTSPAPLQPSTTPPNKKPQPKNSDPTMNFSTLLIAKPMPFKFNLSIRSKARAELVASRWLDQKMQGEFEDARVFWGDGKSHQGDAEYGWGEVFA